MTPPPDIRPAYALPPCKFGMWSIRAWDGKATDAATALIRDFRRSICVGWLLGRQDAEADASQRGLPIARSYWLLLCKPSGEIVWRESLRPRPLLERHAPALTARLDGTTVAVSIVLPTPDGPRAFEGRASSGLSIPDALREAAIAAIRAHRHPPEDATP